MTPRHRAPRHHHSLTVTLVTAAAALILGIAGTAAAAAATDDIEPVTYSAADCDNPEGVAHVPDNTDTIAYLNHGDPDVVGKGYWAAHEIDRIDDEDEGVVGRWAYDFSGFECEDGSEGESGSDRRTGPLKGALPGAGR